MPRAYDARVWLATDVSYLRYDGRDTVATTVPATRRFDTDVTITSPGFRLPLTAGARSP